MSLGTFTQQALSDFQATAAILPSSRYLVEAMVQPLPLATAQVVVEFGPGTGAMTRQLLSLTPPDARVIAFEINRDFIRYLKKTLPYSRLEIVHAPASLAAHELRRRGVQKVDAVLSSLGLGMMPESENRATIDAVVPLMDDHSVFTQFQYVHRVRVDEGKFRYYNVGRFLSPYFPRIRRHMVLRNFPPAFVFECRK